VAGRKSDDGLKTTPEQDGFWFISLYNAEGYFEPNNLNAYTLNNITAKKSRGRLGGDSVWWLRAKESELSSDHERVELCGAPLPATRRDRERQVDVPAAMLVS
jgi:hypothetical protein